MKVIVETIGTTHYQALCQNCDFCEADHADTEYVRQLVYKHVRKTGHSVTIEKGVATHYHAAQQKMHPTKNGRGKSDKVSTPAVFGG